MVDILEVQLVRAKNFTVGTDVHKGITAVNFRKNPPRTIPILKEGDLTPSAEHQVPTDQPKVQGTIRSKSYQVLNNLAGTQAASATFDAEEGGTSDEVTATLANPTFEGADGGITGDSVQGFSLSFRATDITFA